MNTTYSGFTEDERGRIAIRVTTARVDRGWSKEEAGRRASISSITWKRVEDGHTVHETKLRAIEAAFGWAEGTISGVAQGENAHAPTSEGEADGAGRNARNSVEEEFAVMERVAAAMDELAHAPEVQSRVARWALDRYGA